MSLERDAGPEHQSSAEATRLARSPSTTRRVARLVFGGFLLLHFTCQAYRARAGVDQPALGLELRPWFVAACLVLVATALGSLMHASLAAGARRKLAESSPAPTEKARALAIAEQLSLLVVALFGAVHVGETAWPLLTGRFAACEVQPELVLLLSSTSHGAPMHAVGYLCGVGAGSFYATRQGLAALGGARPKVARALVALGVLGYLLGGYAVIRCAGGAFFA